VLPKAYTFSFRAKNRDCPFGKKFFFGQGVFRQTLFWLEAEGQNVYGQFFENDQGIKIYQNDRGFTGNLAKKVTLTDRPGASPYWV
jgi:hypothetical protein